MDEEGEVLYEFQDAHGFLFDRQAGLEDKLLISYLDSTVVYGFDQSTKVNSPDLKPESVPKVYPNPFEQEFTLDLPEGVFDIAFFDITGRQIGNLAAEAMGRIPIDAAGWNPGVYLLRCASKTHVNTVRILKTAP
jgi:hypothetical protein